jgi:cytoskeletal protein CcmA (bactofilin family)
MWRKPNEGKPSEPPPQPASAPVSTPVKSEEPAKTPPIPPPQVAPSAPAPSMASMILTPPPSSSNLSKINAGLKIQGEVSGDTDLYIDGEIQGKVRMTNGRVTVGPNGRVQAEIEARQISVEGTVQGNLKASESTQFGPSSKVVGSVTSPRIGIADGAKLRGKIETIRAPQSPKSAAAESSGGENQQETIGAKIE